MSDKINSLIVRGARAAVDYHKARADRAEAALLDARAMLACAHDTMHNSTAVLTWDDSKKVAAVMADIRAVLAAVEPKP